MRAVFVVLFGYSCTVATAADLQPPSMPLPPVARTSASAAARPTTPTPAATQPACVDATVSTSGATIRLTAEDILKRIDAAFAKKPDLKCDLIAVDPNQGKDVFGDDYFVAKGQPAKLGKTTTWPYVKQAISNALTNTSPPSATFKLQIALRVDIPDGVQGCGPPGVYVMLMSFDTQTMKLFFKGTPFGGEPQIKGDRNYRQLRRILRDVAPTASTGSSS
jgi:hypothetical protein